MHTILSMTRGLYILLLCYGLAASAQSDRNPDGLVYIYTAANNAQGSCQPQRLDIANAEGFDLHAVRGESVFSLPGGETVIPFQSVFGWFDDDGYSTDRATSLLNVEGPCSDLMITVSITHCEYGATKGFTDGACPDIQILGAEAFAGIEFVRDDLAEE
ncbi:MAG: hypothetical protein AAGF57_07090 [Pseudomonadota bacterium]